MKYWILFLGIIATSHITVSANAGQFSDAVGAYLANKNGECQTRLIWGQDIEDFNFKGVCIPLILHIDEEKQDLLQLAIMELKDPEKLKEYLKIKEYLENKGEAFTVLIDKKMDDVFKLVDGSILEKTSYGYVGYLGYRKKAILYKNGGPWRLCVSGVSFNVKVVKMVNYHYSKSPLTKMSLTNVEKLEECN